MGATIQISTGGMPVTGSVFAAAGTVCTFSNLDNTGLGGWAWELVDKPAGSAAVLSSTTATTTQITVDIPGTYMVRLSTYLDGARMLFNATDLQGVGVRYAGTYLWRLPSAYETDQFDATDGWKAELNSILDQIRTALISGSAGHVGPGKCIFVDSVLGNDGTGARGNAALPFATLAAALNAVSAADDCVVLAPGVHAVTATLPQPAVSRLSIIGYGRDVSLIDFTSAVPDTLFEFTHAGPSDRLSLAGFTVRMSGSSGLIALSCNGSGGNGTYLNAGLVLRNLRFTANGVYTSYPAINASFVCRLDISDVIADGSCSFDTCWSAAATTRPSRVLGLSVTENLSLDWDDDAAQELATPMTRAPMAFESCEFMQTVLIDGQADFQPVRCSIGNIFPASALGASVTGIVASIWTRDCAFIPPPGGGGTVTIDFNTTPLQDVTPGFTFYFERSTSPASIFGVAFSRAGTVNGRTDVGFSSLDVPGFAVLAAGTGIDISLSGSTRIPTITLSGGGTFTPRQYRGIIPTGVLAAGNNVISFPWGAAKSAPNAVFLQSTTQDTLAISGFSTTGFTINALAGGGLAYYQLLWGNQT